MNDAYRRKLFFLLMITKLKQDFFFFFFPFQMYLFFLYFLFFPCKKKKPTWLRGKISAMSFLYLLTGCLDLARIAGQKKQRLPQAGKTCREITPETTLIFPISNIYDQKYFNLASKVCFLSLLNQSRTLNFDAREGKERLPSKWAPPKFNGQPEIQNVVHS